MLEYQDVHLLMASVFWLSLDIKITKHGQAYSVPGNLPLHIRACMLSHRKVKVKISTISKLPTWLEH